MFEKYICSYPPSYEGNIVRWAEALAQWLYQEMSKIGGKLNDLEQRVKELE